MPRTVDPAIHRRRLRAELRVAREQAGLTQREVSSEMDWSLSKLIRIETGVVSISTNDLRMLLRHYGVDDDTRVRRLVETARSARQRSVWSAYSEIVSQEFIAYLAYESSAKLIRGFQPLVVPGLLQTSDYAQAIIRGSELRPDEQRVQDLIDLRLMRQEMLMGEDHPKVFFILDEAVIRRVVGGTPAMRNQLGHLLKLVESGVLTLFVVPFRAGMYPLLRWPTLLLEFDDATDPTVLYLEREEKETLIRDGEQGHGELATPAAYLEAFWAAENLALDYSAVDFINSALADL